MSHPRGRAAPSGGRGGDRGRGNPAGRGSRGSSPGGDRGGRGQFRGGGPSQHSGPIIFQENRQVVIPPHLNEVSSSNLVKAFRTTQRTPIRPLRPTYGTLGNPITLRANFFAVKIAIPIIYDYVVKISPKSELPARVKARIFQLLETHNDFQAYASHTASDQAQRIVSAKPLPQPFEKKITFFDEGEPGPRSNARVYTVTITLDKEIETAHLNRYLAGDTNARNFDPQPLLSALNLVTQKHAAGSGFRAGRNKHFFAPALGSLGVGLEGLRGYFTSVRPSVQRLLINVNSCVTAFVVPGGMDQALDAFSRNTAGAMPTLPPNFVKSIRISTKHLGYTRRYKLQGVLGTTARDTKFDCAEYSKKISVEEFFKKKYSITLRRANLPVINIGSKAKPSYVPAELCTIEPGSAFRGRLGDYETSQMLKLAKNPPITNAELIVNDGFSRLGFRQASSPLSAFGVSIDTEMVGVPGRILQPPKLSYRGGRPPDVRNGSWNILDVNFHKGGVVNSWWVLVVRDGFTQKDPRVEPLAEAFAEKLRKSGVQIPGFRSNPSNPRLIVTEPLPNQHQDPGRLKALDIIKKALQGALGQGPKPTFVLVILFRRDNFIYPGIKTIGDVQLGIPTIHMLIDKAGTGNKQDQYLSNVSLKVNTKLGGINHQLEQQATTWLTKKTTMLVGIDVTHPGPGSRDGTPSIAAVVANIDSNFVQFPASLRIQRSKQEMLAELKPMMIERLQLYEKKNKALPQRIIITRDGVSEGQYDQLIDLELPQIREACGAFNTANRPPYRPSMAIVVCGKRHHARFYPTDSTWADKNGNTLPGTVVDKGATAVFDFDFYLQAHAGLQGQVKPTHYIVVYDDILLGADELQKGANDISYLYARATKAVSLMPPAYYADLACERGRCYLNEFLVDDKESSVGRGPRLTKEEEAEKVYEAAKKAWGEGLHPDMRQTMFYI